jgi:hypothetical protein
LVTVIDRSEDQASLQASEAPAVHPSRFSFRFPQCVSLRSELNSRATPRADVGIAGQWRRRSPHALPATGLNKDGPLEGTIRLAASLRSPVGVVVEVLMVMMRQMVRLRTWNRANRERNSRDSCQNESKVPHENFSLD